MNKKQLIVQAAIDSFQTKGIEKTTVSDIVKKAGVAQGTFYLYFSSKLSIMPVIAQVLVEKMISEVKNNVDDEQPIFERLESLIETIFSFTNQYQKTIALVYAGLASSEHLKEWELIYEPFYNWMNDFLKKAQAAQMIRPSIHTEHTAKLMIGFIEMAAEQVYLYDSAQHDAIAIQKEEVLHFIVNALAID